MPVIMMSGHAPIDTAVEATKIGALAFLEKPITTAKTAQGCGDKVWPAAACARRYTDAAAQRHEWLQCRQHW